MEQLLLHDQSPSHSAGFLAGHMPPGRHQWRETIFFCRDILTNSFPYEGLLVNKTELIEHIAKHADISKAAATRALESTIGAVKTTLKKGGSVSLVGFGTFAVGKRAARSGRNPRTGAAIKIKAAKVPKFRPGKALKDALN